MDPVRHRYLLAFITISLTVHLTVLSVMYRPRPNPEGGSQLFQVSLQQTPAQQQSVATPGMQTQSSINRETTQTPITNIFTERSTTHKESPTKLSAENTQPESGITTNIRTESTQAANNPVDSSVEVPQVHTPATVINPEVNKHRIMRYVENTLAKYFHYPPMARRRGWQGSVRLTMRIEADGLLTHMRVLESSGYGILDRSALSTLQKLNRIPGAVTWLRGSYLDMILPVEYRLVGS